MVLLVGLVMATRAGAEPPAAAPPTSPAASTPAPAAPRPPAASTPPPAVTPLVAPAAARTSLASTAASTAASTFDWVTVTLASDDPKAGLYAKDARKVSVGDQVADSWSFVCLAPCGSRVDPHLAYRIMGDSLVPSIEFNVAPGSVSIALDVHARHPTSSGVTTTLAVTGTASGIGGVLLLLVDLVEHGAADAIASTSTSAKHKLLSGADTYGDVGAAMIVGGVALGGAALIYLATEGRTQVAPAQGTTRTQASRFELLPFGFRF